MNRILAALFAGAVLPLAAAAQGEPADTVRLRFGWVPGMHADVAFEQVRVRNAGGAPDSVRMAFTYRTQVDAHTDGLSVRYTDMHWTALPEAEGPAGQFFEALGRTTSGGRPRIVVSDSGEFVRAEGMDEVAAELRQALQPLMAEMQGEGMDVFSSMMDNMLSEETVAASAAAEWGTLVAGWVGADLEVGAVYEMSDSLRVPFLGGMTMPVTVQFQVQDRVACRDGGDDAGCVEIVSSTVPDREGFRRMVGELMQEAGVPEADLDDILGQMQLQAHSVLVVEPATLRPWMLVTTKAVVVGDDDAPPTQVDTETYRYHWR